MPEQTKILAVDTASLAGSVALAAGETLVAETLLNVRSTHSEKLLQQVDMLLDQAGWALADIDLFAVVVGPGSFTGLRIGLATIKGLAQTFNKPVASVSALEVSALGMVSDQYPVCAFLDARKKEVYTQLFSVGPQGPVAASEPRVIAPGLLLKEFSAPVGFVGDGVPVYQELIRAELGANAIIAPPPNNQRRAGQVAWLAYRGFLVGEVCDASGIVPLYIRPSDAELNLPARSAIS